MGLAPSSMSPTPRDAIRLFCERDPPPGYYLVTPAIDSLEESATLGAFLKNLELGVWPEVRELFAQIRGRPGVHGTFALLDPATRLYPVRDMTGEVEVYYCRHIECPSNPRLHGMRGAVVAVESPAAGPKQSLGSRILGALVGDHESDEPGPRKLKIMTFDNQACVDVITTSDYTVELHVE